MRPATNVDCRNRAAGLGNIITVFLQKKEGAGRPPRTWGVHLNESQCLPVV